MHNPQVIDASSRVGGSGNLIQIPSDRIFRIYGESCTVHGTGHTGWIKEQCTAQSALVFNLERHRFVEKAGWRRLTQSAGRLSKLAEQEPTTSPEMLEFCRYRSLSSG